MCRHLAHVETLIFALHRADVQLPVVWVLELDFQARIAAIRTRTDSQQTDAVGAPS